MTICLGKNCLFGVLREYLSICACACFPLLGLGYDAGFDYITCSS